MRFERNAFYYIEGVVTLPEQRFREGHVYRYHHKDGVNFQFVDIHPDAATFLGWRTQDYSLVRLATDLEIVTEAFQAHPDGGNWWQAHEWFLHRKDLREPYRKLVDAAGIRYDD